ncbi:MAG: TonB family protein [Myxococcales bacterium]|nr:TonB family protein [Myxococcales bacterium]
MIAKTRVLSSLVRRGFVALWIGTLASSGCATNESPATKERSVRGANENPTGMNPDQRPSSDLTPQTDFTSLPSTPPVSAKAAGFGFETDDSAENTRPTDSEAVPLVRVPPEYPRQAERSGLEGWVTVEFTVSRTGTVKSPKVVDSTENIFRRPALEAIRNWKYEPMLVGDEPVEQPDTRVTLDFSFGKPCEYKTVYLNTDNFLYKGDGLKRLEEKRLTYLEEVADAASRMGFRIVDDVSDAYFEIKTGAHYVDEPDVQLYLALNGTLKLHHHIFVSLTDDSRFPYRGRLGGSHAWILRNADSRSVRKYPALAEEALKKVWDRDRTQIDALCQVREKLVAEGWKDIEELRQQLVNEMVRVRKERAWETKKKNLSIEIEE